MPKLQDPSSAARGGRAPARHATLSAAIAAEIHAGRHPVGSALPTEAEYQRRFGASRYAVREALRQLKEAGLVTSHAGVGTIVRARKPAARTVQVLGSLDDVLQLVRDTHVTLLGERELVVDGIVAERFAMDKGDAWHVFDLLRAAGAQGEPLARLSVHVRPEFAAVGGELGRARQPVFRLIEERFGERVVEVRQEVGAARLRAADARLLRVRTGTPGLRVLRHFVNGAGRAILVSEGLYPEGRFALVNRLTIASG